MNLLQPVVRSQTQLLADLEAQLRDTGNAKWTDEELYRAINRGIRGWDSRVSFPAFYTFTTSSDVVEYSLPFYMNTPLVIQELPTNANGWINLMAWQMYPSAMGSTIRLRSPRDGQVRVIYRAHNGPVPLVTATTTLVSDLPADHDVFTVINNNAKYPVGRSGYVLIGDEWIQYSGSTYANSDTNIHNLERGVLTVTGHGGDAALHTASSVVYWGVAAPEERLFDQLLNQAAAQAHSFMMTNSPARETEHHQWAMRWHQQMADEFWQTYTPQGNGRIIAPGVERTVYG